MKVAKQMFFVVVVFGFLGISCNSNSGETKTIRINTWDGGLALGYLEQIASDFMQLHPNIKVQVESVPEGLGQSILVQLAGGSAPDIFQIGDGDISSFQARGALRDLAPYINGENPLNLNDFYDSILDIGRIGDGLFALPKDFSTIAIYYNKDMFDEAGIDYPTGDWTWDELRQIANRLTVFGTGDSVERFGLQWASGPRWVFPLVYAFGGDVISPDGSTVVGYTNGDAAIAAIEWYNDFMHSDRAIPSAIQTAAMQGVDLFLSKLTAMSLTGTWPANQYLEAGMNFGTTTLPRGPAGVYGTTAYAGYVMTKDSKHPEEAWLFLRYLVTEGQYLMAQHALSAYTPAAVAVGQNTTPHLQAFIKMTEFARLFPELLNPDWGPTAGRLLNEAFEEIHLGTVTDIRSLLNDVAQRGQSAMEEQMRLR